MRFFDRLIATARRFRDWLLRRDRPGYHLVFIEGDELPAMLPAQTLVVAREDDILWEAGLLCPCGCGDPLKLMLLAGVKPRWDIHISASGRPSLTPSVWRGQACRSHFWLRDGEIQWCRP